MKRLPSAPTRRGREAGSSVDVSCVECRQVGLHGQDNVLPAMLRGRSNAGAARVQAVQYEPAVGLPCVFHVAAEASAGAIAPVEARWIGRVGGSPFTTGCVAKRRARSSTLVGGGLLLLGPFVLVRSSSCGSERTTSELLRLPEPLNSLGV